MRVSIVIPAYNERPTIATVLATLSTVLDGVGLEIIIVDDGSTDGTREWLNSNFPNGKRTCSTIEIDAAGHLAFGLELGRRQLTVCPLYHSSNKGKGGALQTGFASSTGDIVVIQDADLEYDPHDWTAMYDLIAKRKVADVVFGSRFYGRPHRSLYFHHYAANRFISLIFNVLFNQTLSDIECCYKMMTRDVLESLRLSSNDFGIEIEMSAEIARQRQLRIYELGITYYGRTYVEGKKIKWTDGMKAVWYLFKFRFR